MQSQLILILLSLLVFGIIAVIFLLLKKGSDGGSEKLIVLTERIGQLAEQNKDLRQSMDSKLSETHRANQEQLSHTSKIIQGITGQSAKLISDVTEKLTKLDETNRQVVNFSAQLQNLQDILKNPKQRGILGEYYLETLLKNVLPPGQYQMQYGFPDGTIVDAAVFVKDKIIPIDSKFSLENYNRIVESKDSLEKEKLEKLFVSDLKSRIQETAKYIQPNNGTMEFAFMFIPHEAIYYDLLINKIGAVTGETENLIQRAVSKYHVFIVSPTSFLAYLQTVLQGLRAMQIEEGAKEIRTNVEKLGKHISVYEGFMKKLGNTLGTTVNHYNDASRHFKMIDKDITKITGVESEIEAILLDKPKSEE